MMRVCLIADDLTGALDTAAQFTGVVGTIPVFWSGGPAKVVTSCIALDSATREVPAEHARRIVSVLAAGLPRQPGTLYYAKLDSLLRGHAGVEIAAWCHSLAPSRCVIAPAFPYQNRVTHDGQQFVRQANGRLTPVAANLIADLEREGLTVHRCRPGDAIPAGFSVWDAETDADLDAIATAGLALDESVLWCGSAGLAGALARAAGNTAASAPDLHLPRPLLGLFGTNHPVTVKQLSACEPVFLELHDGGAASAQRVTRQLTEQGVAFAGLALPDGLAPAEAAPRIDAAFSDLVQRLDPPGTLVVAGGETLHALCLALGAERLDLDGAWLPGVPCSVMRGGRFDGVRVVSKSGAFGDPGLLRRLAHGDTSLQNGDQA